MEREQYGARRALHLRDATGRTRNCGRTCRPMRGRWSKKASAKVRASHHDGNTTRVRLDAVRAALVGGVSVLSAPTRLQKRCCGFSVTPMLRYSSRIREFVATRPARTSATRCRRWRTDIRTPVIRPPPYLRRVLWFPNSPRTAKTWSRSGLPFSRLHGTPRRTSSKHDSPRSYRTMTHCFSTPLGFDRDSQSSAPHAPGSDDSRHSDG